MRRLFIIGIVTISVGVCVLCLREWGYTNIVPWKTRALLDAMAEKDTTMVKPVCLIKVTRDEHGLYEVYYLQDEKEYYYDQWTLHEYDSLLTLK